ncbi:hypothetical protein M501DRAFT_1003119, partial [Patellaria atrata CBS 101060]
MANSSQTQLTASYTSPNISLPKQFSHDILPPAPSSSPMSANNVAHLSALRSSVLQLQSSINDFLTQKMEEDKASSATNGHVALDEAKEEQNYGEEVVED